MPPKEQKRCTPEHTRAQLFRGYRTRRLEYESAYREDHAEYRKITQWLKEHDDGRDTDDNGTDT